MPKKSSSQSKSSSIKNQKVVMTTLRSTNPKKDLKNMGCSNKRTNALYLEKMRQIS